MFYNEEKTIKACEEEPSLIFELIKEGHIDLVDKLLSSNKVSVNTIDQFGNDVITRLLKARMYSLVLKYMKDKTWDVNHQNNEGNTFAHYLVTMNYVHVIYIIKALKRNKKFMPNIMNKQGQTILDKSINENYIYSTLKILEDNRFNRIDVLSFKKLYEAYIKNSCYGKYSKLSNLVTIIDSLNKKEELLPKMQELVRTIKANMDIIKREIMKNKSKYLEGIINDVLVETIA